MANPFLDLLSPVPLAEQRVPSFMPTNEVDPITRMVGRLMLMDRMRAAQGMPDYLPPGTPFNDMPTEQEQTRQMQEDKRTGAATKDRLKSLERRMQWSREGQFMEPGAQPRDLDVIQGLETERAKGLEANAEPLLDFSDPALAAFRDAKIAMLARITGA